MAVSNRTLFDYFLEKINDRKICSLLTDEDLIEILNLYRKNATSVYFKIINIDVTDVKEPEFYRQYFVGDNIQVNYVIAHWSDGEVDESTVPFCKVNDTILEENVDYTFDINTLTFTLYVASILDATIECGYDFVGEFNNDLSDEELWVIATAMVYVWTSSKYYNADNLKNRMSPKDFKTFSPANLLKEMTVLRKRSAVELRQEVNCYSYNDFQGFN